MNKIASLYTITWANFAIVAYFGSLFLLNHFKIDALIIGVFREILTIPFLLAQFVFLGLSGKLLVNQKSNGIFLVSVLALTICTVLTVISFF
jgi:hypothetical protein